MDGLKRKKQKKSTATTTAAAKTTLEWQQKINAKVNRPSMEFCASL
jgi:hypothetical protein